MSLPAGYVGLLPILQARARGHGYALGLHGSLGNDMDLIAAPWTEKAVDALTLVKALAKAIAVHEVDAIDGPAWKPHGRRAWNIQLGAGARIDISVMPRRRIRP